MSQPRAVDAPGPAPGRRRPAHVLVVEDSPDHRMLIVRALRGAGYEVSTAGSGEQALERLEGAVFDVVLIDHRLPRMSGTDLLRAAVRFPDAPAAVVVTGAGTQQLVVEALRLGAVDYVVKSSEYLAELPAVVARAHRQHDLSRRYRELQRFALLVHEPTARQDTVDEIVTAARRLLHTQGVALARLRPSGEWDLTATAGEVPDPGLLLRRLDARARGQASPGGPELVVDLPADPDEPAGALVLVPEPGTPFEEEEVQLAATFAAFAASALRQVRRLELERDLVDQLQQSVRARQDFIASVSHELRTPLTVIAGYTETLMRRSTEITASMQEHLLDRVLGNAGELRRLIDQLLDVAALERGHELSPSPRHVDLQALVHEVVEEVGFLLEGRPGRREVAAATVVADPALVRRTLVNLVSNACKYSDPGTAVTITLHHGDGEVRLEVSDEGIGVPRDDRARVFEPFWRGPVAVAEAIRGTGIGLALVREYVDALGGRVGIEDGPAGGSVFWFTVPAVPPEVAAGPTAVGGPDEPTGRLGPRTES